MAQHKPESDGFTNAICDRSITVSPTVELIFKIINILDVAKAEAYGYFCCPFQFYFYPTKKSQISRVVLVELS